MVHKCGSIVAICNTWLRFVMAAFFDLTSLRGKITSAYITLVFSTAVLGIIAVSDLLFLERQVTEGEVVSDLKDAVLDMRREEKNLFLYADASALISADNYAVLSLKMIQQDRPVLVAVMSESFLLDMSKNIERYRAKLADWKVELSGEQKSLQEEIRLLGHQLTLSVEGLSRQERRMLELAVRESLWFLLLSMFIIGFSIYIIGRQLKRVVVTPIKQLESSLLPIARGRFDHLEPPSDDREFVAFTRAFNRMLKELETHQKRMLQSEKLASLGILASGVAHELNNPLSNISSSCQLLMEEVNEADGEQINKWLQQIDSETERGRNIVRTLLDFGSQHVFQKGRTKLLDLIKETQLIFGKTLQQSSAELTVKVSENLYLDVDKQRIQQLLINLIQNALHAGGKGVHIRITAALCDNGVSMMPVDAEVVGDRNCMSDYDGRFIEILVADDGPGIAAELLSKVFDPFFTSSEAGHGDGHGIGLGLYIVHEIVREHDGCLAITSQPGKGTQIIVLLPAGDTLHA